MVLSAAITLLPKKGESCLGKKIHSDKTLKRQIIISRKKEGKQNNWLKEKNENETRCLCSRPVSVGQLSNRQSLETGIKDERKMLKAVQSFLAGTVDLRTKLKNTTSSRPLQVMKTSKEKKEILTDLFFFLFWFVLLCQRPSPISNYFTYCSEMKRQGFAVWDFFLSKPTEM